MTADKTPVSTLDDLYRALWKVRGYLVALDEMTEALNLAGDDDPAVAYQAILTAASSEVRAAMTLNDQACRQFREGSEVSHV